MTMKSASVKRMNDLILTLEALADVDAGNVIDHQAIQAWADSLDTDSPLPADKVIL